MSIELLSIPSLLCCLAFFFAGVVDSITGGGGLITIPVMLAVGIPVHYITGTNQCSAWLGTGVAAYKYLRSGTVHFRSAAATLPFAVAGAFIGAKLNLMVPDQALKIFMLVTVPVIAVFVFMNRKLGEEDHADGQPMGSVLLWSALIGLVIGGYSGFYGPGAGLFFILAYTALLKLNLVRAAGTTRFVVTLASITSIVTYAASGTVIWNLAVAATVFNIAGSYLGASLAIKNGARIIRPLMICVVALLIVKLIADVV